MTSKIYSIQVDKPGSHMVPSGLQLGHGSHTSWWDRLLHFKLQEEDHTALLYVKDSLQNENQQCANFIFARRGGGFNAKNMQHLPSEDKCGVSVMHPAALNGT